MADRPLIWLTRPREDSAALAGLLQAHGIDSLIAPVMRIEPLANPTRDLPQTPPNAILLTSRHACHALQALPESWRGLPAYCVGAATAAATRAAGFQAVAEGPGDVLELLPLIAAQLGPETNLLYLAGEETRVDATSLLAAHHIHVDTYICYKAIAEMDLGDDFREQLAQRRLTGAAFFSPRSATLAHQLLSAQTLDTQVTEIDAYCLSLAVAEAAAALPWRTIRACHTPTLRAMLDLIVSCEQAVL